MSDNHKTIIIVCGLVALLGLVGRMDYTDALEQENATLKANTAHCQGKQVVAVRALP